MNIHRTTTAAKHFGKPLVVFACTAGLALGVSSALGAHAQKGQDRLAAAASNDGATPALGDVPLPPSVRERVGRGGKPGPRSGGNGPERGDLLAVVDTKIGQYRRVVAAGPDGGECWSTYLASEPALATVDCGPARKAATSLSLIRSFDETSGLPGLVEGTGAVGTVRVVLSAPGFDSVEVQATESGDRGGRGTAFLAVWSARADTTAVSFDRNGKITGRTVSPPLTQIRE